MPRIQMSDWIALVALIISLLSLGLSLRNHWKSIIRLKITSNDNYCFSYSWHNKYKLAILDLVVENNSSTEVTLTKLTLRLSDKLYTADRLDIFDNTNKSGISLIKNGTFDEAIGLNVLTANILDNGRISSYGQTCGLAIFHIEKIISEPQECELTVFTPNKSFTAKVLVCPLPNNLSPAHP